MRKEMEYILRILAIFLFFAITCKAANKEKYEQAVQYLKSHGYNLEQDKIGFWISEIENKNVSYEDIVHICDLPASGILFFRNSQIDKGAVKGFNKCDQLETIIYEVNTTIYPEDIPDHKLIKMLKALKFQGKLVGDEHLLNLTKLNLKKFASISVGQNVTNQGVKAFVENIGGDVSGTRLDLSIYGENKYANSLIISIGGPKLTNEIFDYFINLKGLNKLYLGGPGCQITEKAASEFNNKYKEKYGQGTPDVMAYIWPEECPRE